MSEKLITIATFNQVIDAHLVKSQLEANGIDSIIENEDMNWLYSSVVSVKLKVKEADVERAEAILQLK